MQSKNRFVFVVLMMLIVGPPTFAMGKSVPSKSVKAKPETGNRMKADFNIGWLFMWGDHEDAQNMDYDDTSWYQVNTPNTVRLEPPNASNGKNYQGVAWYRKHFVLDNSLAGKKIFIEFEAVMHEATVWVNGHKMTTHTSASETSATHSGGYLPFMVDITDVVLLNGEENIIAVKTDNSDNPDIPPGTKQSGLDFNYFGGVYRDVYLVTHDLLYVTDAVYANKKADGGVFVMYEKVKKGDAVAVLNVNTNVKNEYPHHINGKLRSDVVDAKGNVVASAITELIPLQTGEDHTFKQQMVVHSPQLWHPDHPYLYTLQTNVYKDEALVDTYTTRIGIKWIEFTTTDGCLLNGERLVLNGFNRHQEYAYIGYGAPNSLQKRDAIQMKEAGFNICRIGHYPNDRAFMEACDEVGILTVVPTPGWHFFKDTPLFKKRVYQNVRDMIRDNRNHACIAFWEPILNEIFMAYDAHKKVYDITHEEYPVEYCYAATDPARHPPFLKDDEGNYIKDKVTGMYLDEAGNLSPTNYNGHKYNLYYDIVYGWETVPGKCTFSREYCDNLNDQHYTIEQRNDPALLHTWNSRGDTDAAAGGERAQLWASNTREKHGLSSLEGHWGLVNSHKGFSGMCIWSGNDYNRGFQKNFSASGIIDLYRLPKFVYHLYQSQRSPILNPFLDSLGIANGPMVHIANYWMPDSDENVRVYTNCERIKLYCNGVLIGDTIPPSGTHRPHPSVVFPNRKWEAGQLKAEGYIGGRKVAENSVNTPGKANKLHLEADFRGIDLIADGADMVMVYAHVLDRKGNPCPTATNRITFSVVSGPGEIVGDGDRRVGANPVNAEAGIAGMYIQTSDQPGRIKIKASAEGLKDAVLMLQSRPMTRPTIKGILPPSVKRRPASMLADDARYTTFSEKQTDQRDIVLIAEADATSSEKNHDVKQLIDGDLNSKWVAADASLPQTVTLDLGCEKQLRGAYMYWDNDRTSYWFDVYISGDGEAWEKLVENMEQTGQSYTQLIELNNRKARFVKLVVHEIAGPGLKAGLRELILLK